MNRVTVSLGFITIGWDGFGMNRRRFITTAGTTFTVALAGCTSDGTADNDNTVKQATDTSSTQAQTGTTESTTTQPSAELNLNTSSIISGEDGSKWVYARLRNPSSVTHSGSRVNYTVSDESGSVVDSIEGYIHMIPAETTWDYYQMVLGDRREDAATVSPSIIDDENERLGAEELDNVTVTQSTFSKDFQTMTEITGKVRNNGSEKSIALVGLIYTEDGRLRGSVKTSLSELEKGEERGFRAAIVGQWTPKNKPDDLPTEYEIHAFESSIYSPF